METREKIDRASRLILAATGEEWGDGYTVTGLGVGIVDENDDNAVWVTGDWNPARFPRDGEAPLTKAENIGPRLADALERFVPDIHLEWLDEHVTCDDCHRLLRVTANSYRWRMRGMYVEDIAAYLCDRCLLDDFETTLESFVNDERRAITFADSGDLEDVGFTLFVDSTESWREGTYQSGWHPGQDDDPKAVTARIRDIHDDTVDIVYLVSSVGQFDMDFQAYIRPVNDDEEADARRPPVPADPALAEELDAMADSLERPARPGVVAPQAYIRPTSNES